MTGIQGIKFIIDTYKSIVILKSEDLPDVACKFCRKILDYIKSIT